MQKFIAIAIAIAIAAALFAACNNNQSTANMSARADSLATGEHHHDGDVEEGLHQHDAEIETTTTDAVPSTTEATITSNEKQVTFPLSSVYSSYFKLKNALANDDGKMAQTAANELFDNIVKADASTMTTMQNMVWTKYKSKLSFDAEHIKGVDENEHQREHFVTLSKNMMIVIKSVKNDKPVYYQNCPMYDDGKGANWLSLDEKISNPYLGKTMPTCGKQIETIK